MSAPSPDPLAHVPLFAALSSDERDALADIAGEHRFNAGSVLIRQGERGARVISFFLLLDGQARVEVNGREVARLGPTDYVGEIALLSNTARTATVIAETDLRCLTLSSWAFRSFVEKHQSVAWTLLETMAARLADLAERASFERSGVKRRRR
jgi:CRP/FNR family transcriptional regulator, cyclic AMP receptor protein